MSGTSSEPLEACDFPTWSQPMPLSLIGADTPPENRPVAPAPRTLDTARAGDHLDRLYRAACALTGSTHEAEDVVQETYARVLARPRTVDADKELSYLLTAVRRTFIDIRRRHRHQVVSFDELPVEPAARTSRGQPEGALAAREIYAAIARLPGPYRDVIAAVDVAGLSYREAAVALGVPVGTVMSRLFRARERLGADVGACAA
jgi:RNA polymerase sigma-70 factor (ECF subfamily)